VKLVGGRLYQILGNGANGLPLERVLHELCVVREHLAHHHDDLVDGVQNVVALGLALFFQLWACGCR
jgi:hypothetical protein